MFNRVGAAFMFVVAAGFGFITWETLDSEGGPVGTAIWAALFLLFMGLGVWLLRRTPK